MRCLGFPALLVLLLVLKLLQSLGLTICGVLYSSDKGKLLLEFIKVKYKRRVCTQLVLGAAILCGNQFLVLFVVAKVWGAGF